MQAYCLPCLVAAISICLRFSPLPAYSASGSKHASANQLLLRGESERKRGSYVPAEKLIRRALQDLQRMTPLPVERLSAAYNYLALVQNNAGKYLDSENSARKAIELAKQANLSAENIAMHSVVLANALRQQGKYREAEPILIDAISTLRSSSNKVLLGTAVNNLGAIYFWVGEYQKALPVLQEGLNIRLATLGPEHGDVANSYLDMGATEFKIGNIPQATEHLKKSVEINRAKHGPTHPETLAAQAAFAVVLQSQGQTTNATEMLKEVVSIGKTKLGAKHPDVAHYEDSYANALDALAIEYLEKGDFESARRTFAQAVEVREVAGPTVAYAVTLANLADVLSRLKRADESLKTLRKAKAVIDALPDSQKSDPDCASIIERFKNQVAVPKANP